ncbi:hypothetical protein SCP_0111440 [Sparassis crispa]|uniref:GST N-terminal domain-containing protein n=1 Tax=Sparassis crispa TaxID=139825 RepID=A0A401G7W6_9APHY|nr:hypothetical protein SCP_0111440 [Sparassis crispa]GBE78261.1 hypothetical protein SCP_0111440 [Sparassis crispa]
MSKPVLYIFGPSVWATVPRLAVEELGFSEDAIEEKVVNLGEGANFTPEFLKLNPNATLPTLVADGRSYTTTGQVTKYLVNHAPKRVTPGTAFIDKIHEDKYDPNFPLLLARNEEEAKAAASGFPLVFLQNRHNALEKHSKTPEAAEFKSFYDEKIRANAGPLAIFKGEAPEEAKQSFFKQSTTHWEVLSSFILNDLPVILPESGFLGGPTPGEDDFHLGGWLARIVFASGGTAGKVGYKSLEKELKQPVPPKVAAYWAAWNERPSWKKIYADGLH